MPPKKAQAAKAVAKRKQAETRDAQLPKRTKREGKEQTPSDASEDEANEQSTTSAPTNGADHKPTTATTSAKRKSPPTASSAGAKKIPRKGTRASSRNTTTTSASASPRQFLNFLLSPAALEYCYPAQELEYAQAEPSHKTYSLTSPSAFTPFEHLIAAHLLSKPLSHTLGMRAIRTLLNPPFSLNSPRAIVDAGESRVLEALEEARTQHRQKTAAYIHGMASEYVDDERMFELSVAANGEGAEGVVRHVKEMVKGMGRTGAELFCRRIQAVEGWGDAVWPFGDEKCLDALGKMGMEVEDAEDLQDAIEGCVDWKRVGDMGLREMEGLDMDVRVQVEFVVALERAVGCMLEGKVEVLRKAALG